VGAQHVCRRAAHFPSTQLYLETGKNDRLMLGWSATHATIARSGKRPLSQNETG
jgi:hypothetical protein